jgi:hypothetical protein
MPLDAIAPEFAVVARQGVSASEPRTFGGGLINPHYLGFGNRSPKFDVGDLVIHKGGRRG